MEQGEWVYESKGDYDFDSAKDENAVQAYRNSIGYGVTSNWLTDLELRTETEPEGEGITPLRATHIEWENIIQLTRQRQSWLGTGFYFAYEAPLINKQVGEFKWKILLEKSISRFSNTLNINFNKQAGGGADPHMDGGISWSTKYRLSQYFEPGFEYYNDFNPIAHQLDYDQQSHQVGPAMFGHLTRHIHYEIAYVFGLSRNAPQGELKWAIKYEF